MFWAVVLLIFRRYCGIWSEICGCLRNEKQCVSKLWCWYLQIHGIAREIRRFWCISWTCCVCPEDLWCGTIQLGDGPRNKAVLQPGGSGSEGLEAPARWKQGEEVMRWVCSVLQDAVCMVEAARLEDVIQWGKRKSMVFQLFWWLV